MNIFYDLRNEIARERALLQEKALRLIEEINTPKILSTDPLKSITFISYPSSWRLNMSYEWDIFIIPNNPICKNKEYDIFKNEMIEILSQFRISPDVFFSQIFAIHNNEWCWFQGSGGGVTRTIQLSSEDQSQIIYYDLHSCLRKLITDKDLWIAELSEHLDKLNNKGEPHEK